MADVYVEHALRILGRHAKRGADKALEPLGISTMEYDVMEIMARYMANPDVRELTVSVIARRMGILTASSSGYINRLQRSGYARETAGGSRLLTTKGFEKLDECRYALRETSQRLAELFKDYGLEDLASAYLQLLGKEGVM